MRWYFLVRLCFNQWIDNARKSEREKSNFLWSQKKMNKVGSNNMSILDFLSNKKTTLPYATAQTRARASEREWDEKIPGLLKVEAVNLIYFLLLTRENEKVNIFERDDFD